MQHTANVSCNSTKRRMFASKSNLQINSDCGIIGEKVKPTDLCSTLLDAYPWDAEACMARDNEGSQFYLPPPRPILKWNTFILQLQNITTLLPSRWE